MHAGWNRLSRRMRRFPLWQIGVGLLAALVLAASPSGLAAQSSVPLPTNLALYFDFAVASPAAKRAILDWAIAFVQCGPTPRPHFGVFVRDEDGNPEEVLAFTDDYAAVVRAIRKLADAPTPPPSSDYGVSGLLKLIAQMNDLPPSKWIANLSNEQPAPAVVRKQLDPAFKAAGFGGRDYLMRITPDGALRAGATCRP